jgi:exosortase family protein XrtF
VKEFRPVIIFIVKFLAVYFVLLLAYNRYLAHYHKLQQQDPFSRNVAKSAVQLANITGFDAAYKDDVKQPWTWIFMNGEKTSYINEGCNAIAIMIIFVAFIIAFSSTWKKTLLFSAFGCLVIHGMNLLRIFLLNYSFRYHPQYGKAAHDYLFPAFIYGTIVLLWMIWVKGIVLQKQKPNESSVEV